MASNRPLGAEQVSGAYEVENGDDEFHHGGFETREWTTSIDFKDAYFHIAISKRSWKYLRFVAQGKVF